LAGFFEKFKTIIYTIPERLRLFASIMD